MDWWLRQLGGRYKKTPFAAFAQARKATLISSDKDFEHVGSALKILWV